MLHAASVLAACAALSQPLVELQTRATVAGQSVVLAPPRRLSLLGLLLSAAGSLRPSGAVVLVDGVWRDAAQLCLISRPPPLLLGPPLFGLMLAPSLFASLGACGCARLAGPDAAAWRLLDVTAASLLVGVRMLPHLGALAMLSPMGDALRSLASVDSLQLDASSCGGLWLLAAAAALETAAGWLPG